MDYNKVAAFFLASAPQSLQASLNINPVLAFTGIGFDWFEAQRLATAYKAEAKTNLSANSYSVQSPYDQNSGKAGGPRRFGP